MDYEKDFEYFLEEEDRLKKTTARFARQWVKMKQEETKMTFEDGIFIAKVMFFSKYKEEKMKEDPSLRENEEFMGFLEAWFKENIEDNKRLKFSFTGKGNCKVTIRENREEKRG